MSSRSLKKFWASQMKQTPRFRQKMFGGQKELQDDAKIPSASADLRLVILDFNPSDADTKQAFVSACEEDRVSEVDAASPYRPQHQRCARQPNRFACGSLEWPCGSGKTLAGSRS